MSAHPIRFSFRQRHFNRWLSGFLAITFSVIGIGTSWSQTSPRWSHGSPESDDYFPIAVWLQSPRNATKFKEAGINLYVGLHKGPTEDQLVALAKAKMPVICDQNAVALEQKDSPIIVGWIHDDEPDNAQSLGKGAATGRRLSRKSSFVTMKGFVSPIRLGRCC